MQSPQKLWTQTPSDTSPYQTQLLPQTIPAPKPNEVLIKVHYSSLNYKDMLAITGKGHILRTSPLIPGIDLSGEVIQSLDDRWQVGDQVLVTGCGLSETLNGGLANYACIPADLLIKLPEPWTTLDAMRLGTAGFTAGMALERFMHNQLSPAEGPIAITGVSGGVGLWSLIFLHALGYSTHCFTRDVKKNSAALQAFGATEVCSIDQLTQQIKPLDKALYAGAIDQVGGDALAGLLSKTQPFGHVCSIGLALSEQLHMTVMPFILRGVSLHGISSSNCPYSRRRRVWALLKQLATPTILEKMPIKTIELNQVITTCTQWQTHSELGRIIVKL